MKKWFFVIIIFGLFGPLLQAQDVSLERNIVGVQIGYPGAWAYVEPKLAPHVSLRLEAGLFSGYVRSSLYGKSGIVSVPELTVEPRWYYNLAKRSNKSKKTAGNSANFLALKSSFYPNWFIWTQLEDLKQARHIAFIPKWGIRRSIGEHFDFEAGIGIGVRRVFFEESNAGNDKTVPAGDFHLRFGYHF